MIIRMSGFNHVLDEVADSEIGYSLGHGVDAYNRHEVGQTELMLAQARSMAQSSYLRATLSIPDIDPITIFHSGEDLKVVAQPDLLLIGGREGELLANLNLQAPSLPSDLSDALA